MQHGHSLIPEAIPAPTTPTIPHSRPNHTLICIVDLATWHNILSQQTLVDDFQSLPERTIFDRHVYFIDLERYVKYSKCTRVMGCGVLTCQEHTTAMHAFRGVYIESDSCIKRVLLM